MRTHLLSLTALALAGGMAVPAAAQVNGVGVTEPAIAIAGSQALQAAYQQIGTTYQAQRTQLEQLQEQRNGVLRQLDTDNDGQLSEAEQQAAQAANNPVRQQLQTLDQQIAQAQAPMNQARAYVVEQVAQQLSPAVQQVVSQSNVQLILAPSSVLYMADAVDLSDEIIAALNQRVPSVQTTPPQGWQPTQESLSLYQDVQRIFMVAAMQQQQAAANQQAPQGQQQPAAPVQGR